LLHTVLRIGFLMTKLFRFAAARLSEPTTWRGLLFIGTSVGIVLKPELQNAIVAAGMALAGLIGVVVPDPAPTADVGDHVSR
jgi:hypothetical protein